MRSMGMSFHGCLHCVERGGGGGGGEGGETWVRDGCLHFRHCCSMHIMLSILITTDHMHSYPFYIC